MSGSLFVVSAVCVVALLLQFASCSGSSTATEDVKQNGFGRGSAASSAGTVAPIQSGGDMTVPEALHSLSALAGKFQRYVDDGELTLIHNYDLILNRSINSLFAQSSAAVQGKAEGLKGALLVLNRTLLNLHAASHVSDTATSRAELSKAILQIESLKDFYPAETWSAAGEYPEPRACPMHPEVTGKKGDVCTKCRMNLEPVGMMARIFEKRPPLRATITPDLPLSAGRESRSRLYLAESDGAPVLPGELREVHTKKIHLLIVDSSLSDYSHVHPLPTGVPGEYAFTFTPHNGGTYRAWADVVPDITGRQEYVMSDLPRVPGESRERLTPLDKRSIVDGLFYQLTFDEPEIVAGKGVGMRLKVLSQDGNPFTQLEPLMGAFAHVVGFHDDFRTVTHIHPIGAGPASESERGGPELEFHFYTSTPGYLKLFAQVQIGGVSKYAPFGIMIQPGSANTPPRK